MPGRPWPCRRGRSLPARGSDRRQTPATVSSRGGVPRRRPREASLDLHAKQLACLARVFGIAAAEAAQRVERAGPERAADLREMIGDLGLRQAELLGELRVADPG